MHLTRRRSASRPFLLGCGAALALLGGVALARAAAAQPAPPAVEPARPDDFADRAEFEPRGLFDLLRWRLAALRDGLPKPAIEPTPRVVPDLAGITANARAGAAMRPMLTWVGHATMLAQLGGLNVITDPMFSERASPLDFIGPRRHVAPGLSAGQLPHIDVVLISHNHYDHLDDASVRVLARQAGGPPLFIVPLGLDAWMAQRGITNVVALDWWQSHTVAADGGPVDFVLTPVKHWSARGVTDRLKTLWGGYAVFAPDLHLFFAGDTAYSDDFDRIHRRFAARPGGGDFDVALIPIGAYEPRWFMSNQHVNPAEAVQIHLDLGARQSIGIHWGTFELTDESLDQPPRDLAAARTARGLPAAAFSVMSVGESRRPSPRDR